jgi:hypothetical protein
VFPIVILFAGLDAGVNDFVDGGVNVFNFDAFPNEFIGVEKKFCVCIEEDGDGLENNLLPKLLALLKFVAPFEP